MIRSIGPPFDDAADSGRRLDASDPFGLEQSVLWTHLWATLWMTGDNCAQDVDNCVEKSARRVVAAP